MGMLSKRKKVSNPSLILFVILQAAVKAPYLPIFSPRPGSMPGQGMLPGFDTGKQMAGNYSTYRVLFHLHCCMLHRSYIDFTWKLPP